MKELASFNVEVGILPSHSSSEIQPLDLCPNAQFKNYLQVIKPCFPSKHNMKQDLPVFIDQIQDAAESALLRRNVRKGWERAGLSWGCTAEKLNSLRFRPEGIPSRPVTRRFSISGEWITRGDFLRRWEEHDGRKDKRATRRVSLRKKEIERASKSGKRRTVIYDDDQEWDIEENEMRGGGGGKTKKMRRESGEEGRQDPDGVRGENSVSEESTTESELHEDDAVFHPVELRHQKEEDERLPSFSTMEFSMLGRQILEEQQRHPGARERHPVRPFSPIPIRRKRMKILKEGGEEIEKTLFEESEALQLELLELESDGFDEPLDSDSEYAA
jgi:hypothetical protein